MAVLVTGGGKDQIFAPDVNQRVRKDDMIERLESRRLLSTAAASGVPTLTSSSNSGVVLNNGSLILTPFASVASDGTLVVNGTGNAETISVSVLDDKVVVNRTSADGGAAIGFRASRVKRIRVEAGGGNDHVGVARDISRHCTILGGAGNDELGAGFGAQLIGGSGNDKLVILQDQPYYSGTGLIVPANLLGAALLSGGTGNDRLFAGAGDSVVGGGGDDTAILNGFFYKGDPVPQNEAEQATYAQQHFDLATGVEHFDTMLNLVGGILTGSGMSSS